MGQDLPYDTYIWDEPDEHSCTKLCRFMFNKVPGLWSIDIAWVLCLGMPSRSDWSKKKRLYLKPAFWRRKVMINQSFFYDMWEVLHFGDKTYLAGQLGDWYLIFPLDPVYASPHKDREVKSFFGGDYYSFKIVLSICSSCCSINHLNSQTSQQAHQMWALQRPSACWHREAVSRILDGRPSLYIFVTCWRAVRVQSIGPTLSCYLQPASFSRICSWILSGSRSHATAASENGCFKSSGACLA